MRFKLLSLLLAALVFAQSALAEPGTIGTSTSSDAFGSSTQQKSFKDSSTGWVWQFYYDGTQIKAKASNNSKN